MLALATLLTSCRAATLTPTESPALRATLGAVGLGVYNNAETEVARQTLVAQLALTDSFLVTKSVFEFSQTQDAYALDIESRRKAATETQEARETASAATATAIPTSAALTSTALAREGEIAKAQVDDARNRAALSSASRGYLGAGAFIILIILCGFGWAEYKRRIIYAENYRPQELGGLVIYPDGKGAYTHRPARPDPPPLAISAPASTIALEQPEAGAIAVERFIPYNAPGRALGETLGVSSPVREGEAEKREALIVALSAFRARAALTRDGKPSLKLAGMTGPGKPFRSNDDWVVITDVLAQNAIALKDNGEESVLVGTYEQAIARIQDYTRPLELPTTSLPRIRWPSRISLNPVKV